MTYTGSAQRLARIFCVFFIFLSLVKLKAQNTDSTYINIQGNIHTHYDQSMIPNVQVYSIVSSRDSAMSMTDENGYFSFNFPKGSHVNIKPAKNTNPLRNVNVGDVINIQRHLLKIEEITNPYDLIAADVNNDGLINTKDMLEIRELTLHIKSSFSNNTSWRFFSDLTGEEVIIYDYLFDSVTADFTAVKVGNVNKNEEISTIGRKSISQILVDDFTLLPNQVYNFKIPLSQYQGSQGIIRLDTRVANMTIKNLDKSQWNHSDHGHIYFISENKIPYLEFEISSKASVQLSKLIRFSNLLGVKEASIENFGISFEQNSHAQSDLVDQNSLIINAQNINLNLNKESLVLVKVFDILGRCHIIKSLQLKKGSHQIDLNTETLPHSGLYIYRVKTNQIESTRRIIVTK